MPIHEQMVAILKEVDVIAKSEHNKGQNFWFRGIDAVMSSLQPLFKKHGVFLTMKVLSHKWLEGETKTGGWRIHHFVRVQYTFWANDGTNVVSGGIGEAMDSGDKGVAKALSISLKYALTHGFVIPTYSDDDPDATTPDETAPSGASRPAKAASVERVIQKARMVCRSSEMSSFDFPAWVRSHPYSKDHGLKSWDDVLDFEDADGSFERVIGLAFDKIVKERKGVK